MALEDILETPGRWQNASFANRGDIGTLEDQLAKGGKNVSRLFINLPAESEVESGVQFGQQGTEFTGSFSGGGTTIAGTPMRRGMV